MSVTYASVWPVTVNPAARRNHGFSADRDLVRSANDLLADSLPEGVVKFKIDGGSSGYDKVE
jgi:hypothetical protein